MANGDGQPRSVIWQIVVPLVVAGLTALVTTGFTISWTLGAMKSDMRSAKEKLDDQAKEIDDLETEMAGRAQLIERLVAVETVVGGAGERLERLDERKADVDHKHQAGP